MHEVWAEFGPPAYVSAAHAIGFKPRVKVFTNVDFIDFMTALAPGGSL